VVTTYGITGADGFLGSHLRCRLLTLPAVEVRTADLSTFADPAAVDVFLDGCDVVIHLAGVNRGDPGEVAAGNINAARDLVAARERTGARFLLAYSNSTKAGEDNAYGQSKQQAAAILSESQQQSGDPFVELVLPHLFGEHGRPFYNSAVATFAHQLATGGTPKIMVDSELELVHAQEVAQAIVDAAVRGESAQLRPSGTRILVSDALALLQRLSSPYLASGLVPETESDFELRMFNMFRSQLFPAHCPIPLTVHSDPRGRFFETIRSTGKGQASISTSAPGVTRGEHFHFDKIERFVVVSGEAVIQIRRLLHDEVHEYRVSGDEPVAVDMPTLHPHNITNVGPGELVTQFWTNDLFDPEHPDTIPSPV
jgi:UDP-2-acetamido-2,6-beta-L-arabino-hexul-4-ose reductase